MLFAATAPGRLRAETPHHGVQGRSVLRRHPLPLRAFRPRDATAHRPRGAGPRGRTARPGAILGEGCGKRRSASRPAPLVSPEGLEVSAPRSKVLWCREIHRGDSDGRSRAVLRVQSVPDGRFRKLLLRAIAPEPDRLELVALAGSRPGGPTPAALGGKETYPFESSAAITQVGRLSATPLLAGDIRRKGCGEAVGRGHFVSPAARRRPSMRSAISSGRSQGACCPRGS